MWSVPDRRVTLRTPQPSVPFSHLWCNIRKLNSHYCINLRIIVITAINKRDPLRRDYSSFFLLHLCQFVLLKDTQEGCFTTAKKTSNEWKKRAESLQLTGKEKSKNFTSASQWLCFLSCSFFTVLG